MQEIVKYFNEYVSNSIASGANQVIINCKNAKISRSFFKISVGGTFDYSFLFSSIIDSTYSNGSISKANDVCNDFTIKQISVCVCPANYFEEFNNEKIKSLDNFIDVTFNDSKSYSFNKGELICTDNIQITANSGDYLCFQIEYSGNKIPCHIETLIPIYSYRNGVWVEDVESPVPNMIGIKRDVKKRVCYLGDSITQGIGTDKNSYLHWNSLLSSKLGNACSYWNLGIGYGRANDVAQKGVWLYKALQNDVIIVCFGVNDIFQFVDENKTKRDIKEVVDTLIANKKTVILQTIPPFCYEDTTLSIWRNLNKYIKELSINNNILLFDNVSLLSGDKDGFAIYGGHPNETGSRIWANELYKFIIANKKLNFS